MKKIYLFLALALALVNASANEIPMLPLAKKQNLEKKVRTFAPVAKSVEKSKVEGVKGYSYFSRNNASPGDYNKTVSISFKSDNKVEIIGFFYSCPIEGDFNPEDGTIKIYKQALYYNSYYQDSVKLYPQFAYGYDGNLNEDINIECVTFRYSPDTIQTSTGFNKLIDKWIAAPGEQMTFSMDQFVELNMGWDWKTENVIQPIDSSFGEGTEFTFNDNDWEVAGTANINKNGWLLVEHEPYIVTLLKHKTSPNHFILKNPFGKGTPYEELNAINSEGYIYINAESPNCVLVRPFVPGGYCKKEAYESELYFTNVEGVKHYVDKIPVADIISEAATSGTALSVYDETTGIINVPTCRVTPLYDLATPEMWDDVNEMSSSITLNFVIPSAVTDINTNPAPVRYYNLQGMEIASPKASEPVIIKQGSKAEKVIFK